MRIALSAKRIKYVADAGCGHLSCARVKHELSIDEKLRGGQVLRAVDKEKVFDYLKSRHDFCWRVFVCRKLAADR